MKAYQDRFIEKLNALSAEELTRIFKEVLDIKPMKLNDKLIGVLIVYDDFVESETTYKLLN